LLPDYTERRPGNAAVYYGKVKMEQNNFFVNRERLEGAISLLTTPLEKVPAVPVNVSVPMYFIEQAV
jgi:hypothetical protein